MFQIGHVDGLFVIDAEHEHRQPDAKPAIRDRERLKSQNPDKIIEYLVAVGQRAVPVLQKTIADRAFIGRAAALDALARIQAQAAAREFTRDRKDLRWPGTVTPPIPGADKLGTSFSSDNWLPYAQPAHAAFAKTSGAADGILVIQAWDAAQKQVVAAAYAFRDGGMTRLRVTKAAGGAFELGGASAVFGLDANGADITFRRLQQHTTDREVETGRVAQPAVGMRVKLQGYAPKGQIVRRDEGGLWAVHVETPIEGMSDLTVASSALIGLRTEPYTETSTESLSAKIDGETLQIVHDDVETGMAAAMTKMTEFRDEMCRCTNAKCAQDVADEMLAWGKTQSDHPDDAKPSESDAKRMADITKDMTDCMTKAMGAGSP